MSKEIKEKIYEFLKENAGKRYNMKELVASLKVCSRATLLKWVDVLLAENNRDPKINVKDYGNVKLVWVEK